MGKKQMLIKPDVRHKIFGKKSPQKAEYLYISDKLGKRALNQVLKDGGDQFKEVEVLAKKSKEPHYIVITASKLEEGYMAVSLLAGIYNEREERNLWDDDIEEDIMENEEEWEEAWNRIPLVPLSEAQGYFNRVNDSFSSFRDMFQAGQKANDEFVPYWSEHKNMPICIVGDMSNLGYASLENVESVMESFEGNEQVYLLLASGVDSWIPLGGYEPNDNREINSLVLTFTAEEVCIPKKRSVSRYYENVWKQIVHSKGYTLSRGFGVRDLLEEIEKMEEKFSYALMERILKYAVRDKKEGCLKPSDFDFLERFTGKARMRKKDTRSAMECLEQDLVGLLQVKEQVRETVQVMKFNKIRQKMGISSAKYHNVHLMLGAPGTAKTTVAGLMGKIMEEEDLLSGSQFACVNGAELKGMYVGHSAPKTKALFEENDVIVIDEAYSIAGNDGEPDSFSREALAQLVIELEEHAGDKLIIFAGYGGADVDDKHNKMKEFIDANPGIKSRINSTFYFKSYTPQEMVKIFARHAQMSEYQLPKGYESLVEEYFNERIKDENFGNGREARGLFEKVSVQMAKRVMTLCDREGGRSLENEEVRLCSIEDIRLAIERSREENRQILGKQIQKGRIGF